MTTPTNIIEIYKRYKIPPQLQLHQLRVAAVAVAISDSISSIKNNHNIITALLLHDMGNIIKFDMDKFPEFWNPEGVDYWKKIKSDFISLYGAEEHLATYKIAQELNVSNETLKLVQSIGFSKSDDILARGEMLQMICLYSDQRVTPFGVTSLADRLAEGKKRYSDQPGKIYNNEQQFEKLSTALYLIEKTIFNHSKITPDTINDEYIEKTVNELKLFKL